MTGAGIARAAEGWVGVPFRPGGFCRAGCDCVGLLRGVALEVGLIDAGFDPGAYPQRADGRLMPHLRQHLQPIPMAAAGSGSVVVFATMAHAHHVGIVASNPRHVIHASLVRGAVVRDVLSDAAPLLRRGVIGAFAFPGVCRD